MPVVSIGSKYGRPTVEGRWIKENKKDKGRRPKEKMLTSEKELGFWRLKVGF